MSLAESSSVASNKIEVFSSDVDKWVGVEISDIFDPYLHNANITFVLKASGSSSTEFCSSQYMIISKPFTTGKVTRYSTGNYMQHIIELGHLCRTENW